MLNMQHTDAYTDFSSLAKLKIEAKAKTPEAIKEVAKQFESIFLSRVLKTMRQAKLSEGVFESDQSQFYQDMYDQQLALHLSGDSGTGLADIIAKQLSPKQSKIEDKQGIDFYLNEPKRNNHFLKAGLNLDNAKKIDHDSYTVKKIEQKTIQSKQQFIQQMLPFAQNAAEKLGVEANVLIAQAALETGWGKSVIKNKQGESSFNLFNIKADKSWKGQHVDKATLEFDGDIVRKETAGFRSYSSFTESFHDYVDFIKTNPRYNHALTKVANPDQYMHELQQAGYATDPNYADKVMNIYQTITHEVKGQSQVLAHVKLLGGEL